MAQRFIVELTDDIDGSKADETVTFALEGKSYQIDLSEQNAGKLRGAFAEYVGAARRVGGNAAALGGRGKRDRGARRSTSETAAMREWAKANGHSVSERGRIPAAVVAAYKVAH